MKKYDVLVVDDEPANLQKLRRTLHGEFTVHEASGGEEALQILHRQPVAAIITDQRMPGLSGVELLRRAIEVCPDSVRIILTGYTEVEDLMDAINQGHVHRYITKPWEPFALKEAVKRELESWELRRENQRLAGELKTANAMLSRENYRLKQEVEVLRDQEKTFVFKSRAMADLLKLLDRVVQTDSTVLIQGETGTGKELLARYIHNRSLRQEGVFIPVNCGAVPADLIESAFFGHRKGSFTGASDDRKGYFELADGGTLFLDEIGEAPLDLQVKLLRVLQEGEIFRVGGQKARRVDVRIITSTNRNLGQMVEQSRFRQDLFFRLNVFSIHVPPLRTRSEDVLVLAEYFLRRVGERLNKPVQGFEPEVLARFQAYSWPGNVRELENEIERLVILCDADQTITVEMLSDRLRLDPWKPDRPGDLKEQLAEMERQLILKALKEHRNNKTQAAEALGITRQTIITKLKQYQERQL
ncbi:MAG TPA: sigma-54 dependent transcriptional regulator [Acidobacteriota bacterium]|nr:sigma-54 dependent transcriptional regulator [Acidobacteriota bacterium]